MTHIDLQTIRQTAQRMLDQDPDPAVRLKILREILLLPENHPDLAQTRQALADSQWVQRLAVEQRPDGGWGRFHSQDTTVKQSTPSTEFGVERAVSLGLTVEHGILSLAREHIRHLLQSPVSSFPDPPEANDRWPVGVRLFCAAKLALIDPGDPLLVPVIQYWTQVAQRTFASGIYDPRAEAAAHRDLSGIQTPLYYLVLNGKYQLRLLSALPGSLSVGVEKALFTWLKSCPEGINYLGAPLSLPQPGWNASRIDSWFASIELLSLFPAWFIIAADLFRWLWDQCSADGWWDFGPRSRRSTVLPLSDHWRKRRNRQIDWSARALCLLARGALILGGGYDND